jgi:translation initiation factor IF-2
MRVHELAKELNLSSRELLEKLQTLGVEAKSHMSRLEEAAVKRVRTELKKPTPSAKAEPPKGKVVPVEKKPEAKTPEAVAPAKRAEEKPRPPAAPPEEKIEKKELAPASTAVAEPIRVRIPITVGELASRLNLRLSEVIKGLMGLGIFANVNQLLSEEIVFRVSSHFGIPVEKIGEEEAKPKGTEVEADQSKLKTRPPVVTLMGHVDHGKTSLLDAIRKTNVAAREAGQITQHIGAYVVELPGRRQVTFLDTPGHEAFTEMRARGANVTDVVVLVVAADDGVMPQTVEAMDHAREAEVPIVVAVNKCDLPQANPQKVMMQLQKIGLVAEEWGGKTIFCKVSAKSGEGIDSLLEMLLLESEVLELRANPDQPAQGVVIESRLTKGSGPVATVIVQKGTLRVGDNVIAGPHYGRVRALRNDRGKAAREAGPSFAVEVHGLNGVPQAGETFRVVEDEKTARRIAESRVLELRELEMKGAPKHLSLETLYQRIKEGAFKELKLILKADVQGSIEALSQSLEKLSSEKVRVRVIHGGVGGVNESDVMLAAASDAVIIGFHVKADPRAQQMSEKEGVDARYYNIIYDAVEDVKKAMEGLLEPTFHEVIEGRAEVRQIFRSSKVGTAGGGVVLKGKLTRAGKIRLVRNQNVVFEGKFASLRRFKDDVREVAEGYEFGFVLEGFSDLREKDILEAYRLEKGPTPQLR